MENLSNELLIEAYIQAIKLDIEEEFQLLLKEEILRRKMEVNHLFTTSFNKDTKEN